MCMPLNMKRYILSVYALQAQSLQYSVRIHWHQVGSFNRQKDCWWHWEILSQKIINLDQRADVWSETWHRPVTSFVNTSTGRMVRSNCLPRRVKQKSDTDVCVLNWKTSGVNWWFHIYLDFWRQYTSAFHFKPIDVVCDSRSIVAWVWCF